MPKKEKRSTSFIIESRHAGLTLLTSIRGYSSTLQTNIIGEVSDAHRKALQVIFDCCETPWKSWITLTELIENNEDEKVIEILSQIDGTGQSYLNRNFVCTSLASLEIAKRESTTILEQTQQLTDEQRFYVEIIDKNCRREIDVWEEIALVTSGKEGRIRSADRAATLSSILLQDRIFASRECN